MLNNRYVNMCADFKCTLSLEYRKRKSTYWYVFLKYSTFIIIEDFQNLRGRDPRQVAYARQIQKYNKSSTRYLFESSHNFRYILTLYISQNPRLMRWCWEMILKIYMLLLVDHYILARMAWNILSGMFNNLLTILSWVPNIFDFKFFFDFVIHQSN
jgi:hypothetical protein